MNLKNVNYAPLDSSVLERLPRVMRRVGLSKSEIYRRIQAGTFPSPIHLGPKTVAWEAAAVAAWIADRVAHSKKVV